MKEIVDQTGLTAEWYELEGDNAVIRNRVEPTNVSVKVVAQAGFVRVLNYEFDAVAKLFLAYHELPSPLPKFIRRNWDEIIPLSAETVRNELEKVKKDFVTDDKYFNHNGVRRCAMAIFDSQENFLGVLALTGHYHPSSNKVQRRGIELLKRYYKELKHVL